MAYLIGYMLGFYLLYALLALCFKHKIGFIVSVIIGAIIGITNLVINQNFFPIIAITIASLLIFFVPKMQIKSKKDLKQK